MTDMKARLMTPRILWGAFLFSHLMFVGVAHYLQSQGGLPELTPEELEAQEMFTFILVGLGVVNALVSAIGVPMFMKGEFFSVLIIRFAFAESVTIFGLVLAFLGMDLMWLHVLAAVGATAHVAAYPTERDYMKFQRDKT